MKLMNNLKKIKVFIFLSFLLFSFQPYTKADSIKDFEMDGFSIGDSMLNFSSEKNIKNNIQPYFEDERKYYVIYYNKNLKVFDDLEIYFKTNDKNYIIKSLNAGLYPKNLDECLVKKGKIVEEISKSLNLNFNNYINSHSYYKNTKIPTSDGNLNDGYITVQCLFWDEKDKKKHPMLIDNLAVQIISNEIEEWFKSGYE